MNKVTLSGYLAKTPVLRQVNESYVTNFILKVRRPYSKKPTLDYLECVAWGKTAQRLCEYRKENDFITIEGHFRTKKDYSNNSETPALKTIAMASTIEWAPDKDIESPKRINEEDAHLDDIDENIPEDEVVFDLSEIQF